MSRIPVEIKTFALAELDKLADVGGFMRRAFEHNPYAASGDCIVKIAGYCEGNEAGHEYVFPLRIKSGKEEFDVLSGSGLCVDAKYRRSGLGMDLPELRWQKSPNKIALGAALSQMALPVHQLLDYVVFLLPRNIMLWRSRALVETKLNGFVAKCVSVFVDCLIYFYALALSAVRSCKLAGIKLDEASPDDETTIDNVSSLIAEDGALFAEIHTK